jgi:hypothetical protein
MSDGFYSNQYEADVVEEFVDVSTGEVVDQQDVKPFDIIKSAAINVGAEIRDPKSGCKHCCGEGYVGRDAKTKMPIPCSCIYPPKSENDKENERVFAQQNPKINRQMFRRMLKNMSEEDALKYKKGSTFEFTYSADKTSKNKKKRNRKKKRK